MPTKQPILIPAVAAVSVALGALLFATGSVAAGVVVAALGGAALVGFVRQLLARNPTSDAATKYHEVKAFAVFGVCAIGGLVVFCLAIAGVMHEPVVWALFGLAAVASSGWVLLVGVRNKRREP